MSTIWIAFLMLIHQS